MRTYEVVLIIQPDLDETAINALVEKVKGWITDKSGSIDKVELWGKRNLSYIIRKQRDGFYVFIQSQIAPTFVGELERNLRFLEPVMRFLITEST